MITQVAGAVEGRRCGAVGHRLDLAGAPVGGAARVAGAGVVQPVGRVDAGAGGAVEVVAEHRPGLAGRRRWHGGRRRRRSGRGHHHRGDRGGREAARSEDTPSTGERTWRDSLVPVRPAGKAGKNCWDRSQSYGRHDVTTGQYGSLRWSNRSSDQSAGAIDV